MEDHKSLGGLDRFKVIAALLVVAVHTAPLSGVNDTLDFLLTGVLARIAVPFFLMTTGYFLLPPYLFERSRDRRPLFAVYKKTFLLYGVAILLYLPINLYAGQLRGIGFFAFLRMLIFDGTFYHLWYLPASILGVWLLVCAGRKLPFAAVGVISLLLYAAGLMGDSYYGLIPDGSLLDTLYRGLFCVFSYTRNGIFYAPVFLAMGAGIRGKYRSRHVAGMACGLVVSVAWMIAEGLTLRHLGVQRHNSMYIALLPVMFFLFQLLLQIPCSTKKALRDLSAWIYILHPLVIVLVRGAAKLTHTQRLFIENSVLHYLAVCALSAAFAAVVQKILSHYKRLRAKG